MIEKRTSGILIHLTSLPGKHGIGDFGPGAYMFIGNGDTAQCHHPAYNFDDEAIPVGCSWFAEIVERRMPVWEFTGGGLFVE